MSTRSLSFAAPFALVAALFSLTAQAQSTCESSADCPMGYDCQVTGGATCAQPACEEGQECPPVDCEPQTFSSCVAVPDACTTNADCSAGMVCYAYTYEECSGEASACAPGQDCPPPPPPECTTHSESACIPQYVLPCQTAADCGAGFECKPEEICQCSGGGGTPPPSDGADGAGGAPDEPAPEPFPEPSCSCEPTGTNYCAIIEKACENDAECPADWTCGNNPEGVVCGGAAEPAEPGGTPVPPDCGSTEPEKVCLPPYAETVIGVSRGDSESGGGSDVPVLAGDDNAGSQAGLGEGAPADPTTSSGGPDLGADDGSDKGGCSVGGPSSSSAAWLSLLGLAALLRGRRRR